MATDIRITLFMIVLINDLIGTTCIVFGWYAQDYTCSLWVVSRSEQKLLSSGHSGVPEVSSPTV